MISLFIVSCDEESSVSSANNGPILNNTLDDNLSGMSGHIDNYFYSVGEQQINAKYHRYDNAAIADPTFAFNPLSDTLNFSTYPCYAMSVTESDIVDPSFSDNVTRNKDSVKVLHKEDDVKIKSSTYSNIIKYKWIEDDARYSPEVESNLSLDTTFIYIPDVGSDGCPDEYESGLAEDLCTCDYPDKCTDIDINLGEDGCSDEYEDGGGGCLSEPDEAYVSGSDPNGDNDHNNDNFGANNQSGTEGDGIYDDLNSYTDIYEEISYSVLYDSTSLGIDIDGMYYIDTQEQVRNDSSYSSSAQVFEHEFTVWKNVFSQDSIIWLINTDCNENNMRDDAEVYVQDESYCGLAEFFIEDPEVFLDTGIDGCFDQYEDGNGGCQNTPNFGIEFETFIDGSNGVYDEGEVFVDALNGVWDDARCSNSTYATPVECTGAGHAWIAAEEFTDLGNGVYNEGEEYIDLGNGVYDEGEVYVDENGVYDEGESFSDALNGVYDEDESFTDALNGTYDEGEDFTDALNGVYDQGEEFFDVLNGAWDDARCSDSTYATPAECTGAGHAWIAAEQYIDGDGVWQDGEVFVDALNGVWDDARCSNLTYSALTECTGAGYTWIAAENFYDALNGTWDDARCSNSTYATPAECTGAGHTWIAAEEFTDCELVGLALVCEGQDGWSDDLGNGIWDDAEILADCGTDGLCPGDDGYIEPDEDDTEENGVWDPGESFFDINGDEEWNAGEPFVDALNGVYDEGEEFDDALNNVYDEGEDFTDILNGAYDEGEAFTDGNGIYDEGEDFTDALNGVWDDAVCSSIYYITSAECTGAGHTWIVAEDFTDALNGAWDDARCSNLAYTSSEECVGAGHTWIAAEEFTDGNGIYDEGEEFIDLGNGVWDDARCSDPDYAIPAECTGAGHTWIAAEEFTDLGNGVYDEGEEFIDSLNGIYDEGETFADGNGVYDEGENFIDCGLNSDQELVCENDSSWSSEYGDGVWGQLPIPCDDPFEDGQGGCLSSPNPNYISGDPNGDNDVNSDNYSESNPAGTQGDNIWSTDGAENSEEFYDYLSGTEGVYDTGFCDRSNGLWDPPEAHLDVDDEDGLWDEGEPWQDRNCNSDVVRHPDGEKTDSPIISPASYTTAQQECEDSSNGRWLSAGSFSFCDKGNGVWDKAEVCANGLDNCNARQLYAISSEPNSLVVSYGVISGQCSDSSVNESGALLYTTQADCEKNGTGSSNVTEGGATWIHSNPSVINPAFDSDGDGVANAPIVYEEILLNSDVRDRWGNIYYDLIKTEKFPDFQSKSVDLIDSVVVVYSSPIIEQFEQETTDYDITKSVWTDNGERDYDYHIIKKGDEGYIYKYIHKSYFLPPGFPGSSVWFEDKGSDEVYLYTVNEHLRDGERYQTTRIDTTEIAEYLIEESYSVDYEPVTVPMRQGVSESDCLDSDGNLSSDLCLGYETPGGNIFCAYDGFSTPCLTCATASDCNPDITYSDCFKVTRRKKTTMLGTGVEYVENNVAYFVNGLGLVKDDMEFRWNQSPDSEGETLEGLYRLEMVENRQAGSDCDEGILSIFTNGRKSVDINQLHEVDKFENDPYKKTRTYGLQRVIDGRSK